MHQIFCVSDVKNKKSLNPILYFIASFPKLLWDFISELINLKYTFNVPFKSTLKTIIMLGTSFPLHHNGVQLNILSIFSSEILLLNWAKKAFVEGLGLLSKIIMKTFNLKSSTNLHRLTLSQCGKVFGLSATRVAYKHWY